MVWITAHFASPFHLREAHFDFTKSLNSGQNSAHPGKTFLVFIPRNFKSAVKLFLCWHWNIFDVTSAESRAVRVQVISGSVRGYAAEVWNAHIVPELARRCERISLLSAARRFSAPRGKSLPLQPPPPPSSLMLNVLPLPTEGEKQDLLSHSPGSFSRSMTPSHSVWHLPLVCRSHMLKLWFHQRLQPECCFLCVVKDFSLQTCSNTPFMNLRAPHTAWLLMQTMECVSVTKLNHVAKVRIEFTWENIPQDGDQEAPASLT